MSWGKTRTFYLTKAQNAFVDAFVEETGWKLSRVVTAALAQYFASKGRDFPVTYPEYEMTESPTHQPKEQAS